MSSAIWKHFKQADDKTTVTCNICNTKLKYFRNTSSMWTHVKKRHYLHIQERQFEPLGSSSINPPEAKASGSTTPNLEVVMVDDIDANQETVTDVSPQKQPKIDHHFFSDNISKKRQEYITEAITEMVAEDMLALSFVEGNGFKRFLKKIIPNYNVVSRNTIKSRILLLHDLEMKRMKTKITELDTVALTTDLWTARNNDSYITVTLHAINNEWKKINYTLSTEYLFERHTAYNLRKALEEIIIKWNLTGKVSSVVTDNAVNIMNAVRDSVEIEEHVNCFAHTLQLSISKGLELEKIQQVLSKCSAMVGHFKHSSVASIALSNAQTKMQLPQHKLIQCVKTRWNSQFYMVDRLLEQRQAIITVIADKNITTRANAISLEISEYQWVIIENLKRALQPFELATKVISSESYPTISMVFPLVQSIIKNFLKLEEHDCVEIKAFKKTIETDLLTRYKMETSLTGQSTVVQVLDVCSFLDPRYKNKERAFTHHSKVKRYIENIIDINYPTTQASEQASAAPSAIDILFPNEDNLAEQSAVKEIDLYCKESQINKNLCPIEWWKRNNNRFPTLSILARKYLAVPATSTPSERVFSTAGNIVSAKRSCLKGKMVDALVFLSENRAEFVKL